MHLVDKNKREKSPVFRSSKRTKKKNRRAISPPAGEQNDTGKSSAEQVADATEVSPKAVHLVILDQVATATELTAQSN